MPSLKWTRALPLMVLFAMQSMTSSAEPRIGVAASTRPNAEGIVGANSQTLSAGSEIYENETVRTGNRGVADLVFIDSSNLSVGPTSEVLLDKFIYDPIGSSGIIVSQATRGAFQFATGSQDYRVNPPYGTLGLLGSRQVSQIRPVPGEGALAYAAPAALALAPGDAPSTDRSVVVMVVKPPGEKGKLCRNGRPPQYGKPCPEDCEVVLRLVRGTGATYRHTSGKVANLMTANSAACFTTTGQLVLFTSSESILSFTAEAQTPPAGGSTSPPGGGGVTPPLIVPVSPTVPR